MTLTQTQTLTLVLDDPDDVERVRIWQSWGASEEVVLACAVNRRIARLAEALAGEHHHIVIASFPKSASTYLNNILVEATGFRSYLLNTAGHDNERNIDPASIPMFLALDTVSQEHMRATRPNVAWLQRLQVRPVVLVRNLFDALLSSRDFAMQGHLIGPNAHVPQDFVGWSIDQQLWFMARMAAPWYLNFFASWQDAHRDLPTLWISYDDVVLHTARTVARIAEHTGIPIDADRTARAVAIANLRQARFNCGLSGRGVEAFSAAQRQCVRDHAASFNSACDFSSIGL